MPREPGWEPLLTLEYEGLTAAVCRTAAGSFWLTSDLDGGGGTGLEWFEPALEESEVGSGILGAARALLGRAPVRTVLGGRVPNGAVRVEVQDATGGREDALVGNGAWLAILDEEADPREPIVTFRDRSGAPLRAPHPPGSVVEAVPDADSPCPSCGHREWALVTSPSPFALPDDPTQSLACTRCGHLESRGGIILAVSGPEDEAEMMPVPTWSRRELATVRRARFAVYGLSDWTGPRSLGGFGTGRRGRLEHVDLVYGREHESPWLGVETSRNDDELDSNRELALRALMSALWLEVAFDMTDAEMSLSEEALILRTRHLSRGQERRTAASPAREVAIDVDARPVTFLLRGTGESWGAAARQDGLTLTLSARGIEPDAVVLERVRDLEPYLTA